MKRIFDINPELGCITCCNVFHRKSPVKYIHNSEEGWLFLCGSKCHYEENCMDDEFIAVHIIHLIGSEEIYNIFTTLEEGYEAHLQSTKLWKIVRQLN
jgi:hypothetical protein